VTTRTSSAQWNGDLKGGNGEVTVGDGVFTGAYTFVSRFEEGDGTNPEELIAAAHAACFSMAFSGQLSSAGHEPTSIRTEATVHLEKVDDKPTVTRIVLHTVAEVPGIDEATFQEKAENAKAGCPISRLLAAAEIELQAELKS
jgi:lipoyl-dependent peroxiredoxin